MLHNNRHAYVAKIDSAKQSNAKLNNPYNRPLPCY